MTDLTPFLGGLDKKNEKIKNVAFPNRKSIIFDNKLEFSGTKLAES